MTDKTACEELKVCPFCGGVAEYTCTHLDENEYVHQITCGNETECAVSNCFVQEYDKQTAIKHWNTRPNSCDKPNFDDIMRRNQKLEVSVIRLVEALASIAKNTCCDRCQESALVAKQALAASSGG